MTLLTIVLRQRHPNEWPTPVSSGTPAAMAQAAHKLKQKHPDERITTVQGQEHEVTL